MAFATVIFAAGLGTRMKSKFPKVLHEAAGRPLVEQVIRAVLPLKPEKIVVVIGHGAELVKEKLSAYELTFVHQKEQLGTGHALMTAEEGLKDFEGDVLVLNGDGPLLRTETLEQLVATQADKPGMTVATCKFSNPYGMGRIIRSSEGKLEAIIEEKDASPEQRKITEVNPGLYVFDSTVFAKTKRLTNNNKGGEYYVTDVPLLYLQDGQEVRTYFVEDEEEVLGVNDRKHLAHIDGILQNRIRDRWLLSGVTMTSPETTFIDDTVEIARDVVLEPGVILKGNTTVAESARIGAYSYLSDCTVGESATVGPHSVAKDKTFV